MWIVMTIARPAWNTATVVNCETPRGALLHSRGVSWCVSPFTVIGFLFLYRAFKIAQRLLCGLILDHRSTNILARAAMSAFNHWRVAPTFSRKSGTVSLIQCSVRLSGIAADVVCGLPSSIIHFWTCLAKVE